MTDSRILTARNLSYGTPTGRVLARDLAFELRPGQLLFVTGPNGSGKSTLLKAILGRVRPLRGELACAVPAARVGFLPQLQNTDFHLPFSLADVLQVAAGRSLRPDEATRIGLLEPGQLGLAWNTASGGERKRALLTRILLGSPKLLLMDEPMNHLDRGSRGRVAKAVASYLAADREQRAAVLVGHEELLDSELSALEIVRLQLSGSGEEP